MGARRATLIILGFVIGILNGGFAAAQSNGVIVESTEPVGPRLNPCNSAIVAFVEGGRQITVTRQFKEDGSDQIILKIVTSAKGVGTIIDPDTMAILSIEDYVVNEEFEFIFVDNANTTITTVINEHVISKSRTQDFTSHMNVHTTFSGGVPSVVVENDHSSCP